MKYHLLLFSFILPLFLTFTPPVKGRDKKGRFIVVLDAGHGGHDSGALGKKCKEKDITLSVTKKVGEKLKQLSPNIIVHYTRIDDTFIGLNERSEYAIQKEADLFVSIHANATTSKSAYGSETYVLGLHRTQDNLEVAMKENSAILLEDGYTQKYEEFNPNSSESYIIFQFMQNKHLEASIRLADLIQSNLVKVGRYDRGVKQAGFLVLRKSAMPSVLIELGFVTNPNDAQYMISQKGQNTLATQIASAIVSYEKSLQKRTLASSLTKEQTKKQTKQDSIEDKRHNTKQHPAHSESDITNTIYYRIQVFANTEKLHESNALVKDFPNDLRYYKEGKLYKYTLYNTSNFNEIQHLCTQLKQQRRFKDCFIVSFNSNGQKIKSFLPSKR